VRVGTGEGVRVTVSAIAAELMTTDAPIAQAAANSLFIGDPSSISFKLTNTRTVWCCLKPLLPIRLCQALAVPWPGYLPNCRAGLRLAPLQRPFTRFSPP
jgi:hypothetical protein